MTYENETVAREALVARIATLSDLRMIVADYPQLRAMVAAYPEVDSALLGWLADLDDPEVDEALQARASPATHVPVEIVERTPVSRPVLIAIAAVVAVALVTGLAVGLPRLINGAPGSGTQGHGGPGSVGELHVTGQPPSAGGSWASGTRRVWRVDARHRDTIQGGDTTYEDIAPRTAGAWAMTDFVGDTSRAYWGLNPDDGSVLWGSPMYRACADDDLDGLVPCLDHVRKGADEWEPALLLVDWATSKAVTTTKFSDLGLGKADLNPVSEVSVVDGQLVLTLPSYPHQAAEYLGDLAGVTVARVSADGKRARWVASSTCTGDDWRSVPGELLTSGILTPGYGIAVDFETGKSLLDPKACPARTGRGVLRVDPASKADVPAQVTGPDGTVIAISRADRSGFRLADAPPPQPLTLLDIPAGASGQNGSRAETAKLTAIDPTTGKPAWATPLDVTVTVQDDAVIGGLVSFDGQRLLVLEFDGRVRAVDPATGNVLWTATSPSTYELDRTADGTLLVGNYQGTIALDPETGAQLWSLPGDVRPAPGRDGQESLLQLVADVDSTQRFVARLVPADRPAKARVAPQGTPACPAGMRPISWTRYEGGAVLLCRQGQHYSVVMPDHPDWQATELAFVPGGHRVTFGNGVQLRSTLGGALIELIENGQPRLVPVSESWSDAAGKVTFTAPAGLPRCPSGSWPISLSVFDGGWLLVCGTGPAQPTAISYASGTGRRDTDQVTFGNGGYCGDLDGTRVCAYHAPALVTERTAGNEVQHSVSSGYFTGRGVGGSGRGTGSFGVESPRDNDKDQVRYLRQILQRSTTGRSNLDAAVNQVRSCTDLAEAITTLRSVTANREELLAALDATPLTAVPDGVLLVARLRNALTLSRDSDLVWVQWAESEQASGCAQSMGNPLYAQVTGMNRDVARAKDDFLALWNKRIAPAYGVSTFSRSQI